MLLPLYRVMASPMLKYSENSVKLRAGTPPLTPLMVTVQPSREFQRIAPAGRNESVL